MRAQTHLYVIFVLPIHFCSPMEKQKSLIFNSKYLCVLNIESQFYWKMQCLTKDSSHVNQHFYVSLQYKHNIPITQDPWQRSHPPPSLTPPLYIQPMELGHTPPPHRYSKTKRNPPVNLILFLIQISSVLHLCFTRMCICVWFRPSYVDRPPANSGGFGESGLVARNVRSVSVVHKDKLMTALWACKRVFGWAAHLSKRDARIQSKSVCHPSSPHLLESHLLLVIIHQLIHHVTCLIRSNVSWNDKHIFSICGPWRLTNLHVDRFW